jgi:hypothetical protein
MYNDGKPIGADHLKAANINGEHADAVKMTELFANVALMATHDMTHADQPYTGGIAMTSFACCAGIVQGEMEAAGIVPELTDEAITKLLVANFKTGRDLGLGHKAKIDEAQRAAEVAKAADELAARGGKTDC